MKSKYPQVCLVFIPTNCMGKFQPIDIILQWPLKHSFKQQLHIWISLIIKKQKQNKMNLRVDFQMSMIKPYLCAQFFHAWTQFNVRKAMICKGWEKTSPFQSFNLNFHMETSIVNATKILFSSNHTQ
jgi:hypothetical protein